MLILKGSQGKSKLLYDIVGNNLYFEYNDYPVNFGGYFLNSLNHSIEDLKDYIKAHLSEEDKSYIENFYDYLIIYTNQNEGDLKDFITWLEDNERWFSCRHVVIACK